MSRLAWSVAGSRFYEAGVDRGVLYVGTVAGVPWTGLISVEENPSGGDPKPLYLDGVKYLNRSTAEEFEATIKAYSYPNEFAECDGTARVRPGLSFTQQPRIPFGFSYRTMVGNDIDGSSHAYKLHLVYDAMANPSSRSASSFGDSIEASDFSWSITTRPRQIAGYKATAHVVVDSRYTHPLTLAAIEDILYGNDTLTARLPTPEELMAIFDIPVVFSVHDNGDGSFLVQGLDENVADIGLDQFVIDHPSVVVVNDDSFTLAY